MSVSRLQRRKPVKLQALVTTAAAASDAPESPITPVDAADPKRLIIAHSKTLRPFVYNISHLLSSDLKTPTETAKKIEEDIFESSHGTLSATSLLKVMKQHNAAPMCGAGGAQTATEKLKAVAKKFHSHHLDEKLTSQLGVEITAKNGKYEHLDFDECQFSDIAAFKNFVAYLIQDEVGQKVKVVHFRDALKDLPSDQVRQELIRLAQTRRKDRKELNVTLANDSYLGIQPLLQMKDIALLVEARLFYRDQVILEMMPKHRKVTSEKYLLSLKIALHIYVEAVIALKTTIAILEKYSATNTAVLQPIELSTLQVTLDQANTELGKANDKIKYFEDAISVETNPNATAAAENGGVVSAVVPQRRLMVDTTRLTDVKEVQSFTAMTAEIFSALSRTPTPQSATAASAIPARPQTAGGRLSIPTDAKTPKTPVAAIGGGSAQHSMQFNFQLDATSPPVTTGQHKPKVKLPVSLSPVLTGAALTIQPLTSSRSARDYSPGTPTPTKRAEPLSASARESRSALARSIAVSRPVPLVKKPLFWANQGADRKQGQTDPKNASAGTAVAFAPPNGGASAAASAKPPLPNGGSSTQRAKNPTKTQTSQPGQNLNRRTF